jgi:GNAT superfamily N-acetyltransferase
MDIQIRRAEKTDCKRMMELIHELAIYEKAPEQVTVTFDHFVETGFGKQPVWWAFVASFDGRVEGFALYYKRYSTWKGLRLYLEDFVVTEKLRGMGAGAKLFERLLQECEEGGYTGMMWQVLDWNEPAINFYKKYPQVNMEAGWLNCNINL